MTFYQNTTQQNRLQEAMPLEKANFWLALPQAHEQTLMLRQLELEKDMADKGRARYFQQTNKLEDFGKASQTSYGISLMKRGIESVAQGLNAHIARYQNGNAGRKTILYHLIKYIDTKIVAFISLRKLLDVLSHNDCKLTYTAQLIGRAIELELKMDSLEKEDKDRYDATHWHLKGNNHAGHRRKVFAYAFNKSESVTFKPFKDSEAIQLGMALLNIIKKTLGIFEETKERISGEKYYIYYIKPTSRLQEWIEKHKDIVALLNPDYLPMLVPPKPWTSTHDGGYYSDALPCLHLMKTTDKDHLDTLQERIEQGKMEKVLTSLNALQNTAWKVNTKVLEVVKHLWGNTACDVAGLPSKEKYRLPLCPICGQDLTDQPREINHACFDTMNEKEVKAWKA